MKNLAFAAVLLAFTCSLTGCMSDDEMKIHQKQIGTHSDGTPMMEDVQVHEPGFFERHSTFSTIIGLFIMAVLSSVIGFTIGADGGFFVVTPVSFVIILICWYWIFAPMFPNESSGVIFGGFVDTCLWGVRWLFSGMPKYHY